MEFIQNILNKIIVNYDWIAILLIYGITYIQHKKIKHLEDEIKKLKNK